MGRPAKWVEDTKGTFEATAVTAEHDTSHLGRRPRLASARGRAGGDRCGRIPASVALVEVVYERSAPPLPPDDASARDASIDVRARDEKGAPVGGARVRVLALRDEADGRRAYAAGEGTAGPDGHVRLLRLPRGEAWITADAEGRARGSSAVVLERGDRSVELVLVAGHRLDVEVKDERGEAIAGAEIEAAQADPLPIGARTGADGMAHVTRLGAPPWTVTARAKGFDEVTTHGAHEGEPMRMVLHKLGAIAVHVVDEHGAGVAGARVQIASPSLWPARSAECDGSGAVRIGALPAGTYALRATSGDLASPIELGTELARGEEANVTLRLAASVTVAVHVVGDDDAAVFGARVTLAESGISPFPVEATTNREGRARLGPIARGAASVAVRAESFVARELAVPDPLPAEVRIALAHAGAIEGRVVDARGFPIDGATIEIRGDRIRRRADRRRPATHAVHRCPVRLRARRAATARCRGRAGRDAGSGAVHPGSRRHGGRNAPHRGHRRRAVGHPQRRNVPGVPSVTRSRARARPSPAIRRCDERRREPGPRRHRDARRRDARRRDPRGSRGRCRRRRRPGGARGAGRGARLDGAHGTHGERRFVRLRRRAHRCRAPGFA